MSLVTDLSEANYHNDPCPVPSLSRSTAQTLLDKSPLHAWHQHPKLGGSPVTPTVAMDHGSLMHLLLLGKGPTLQEVDADSWRTKAAKEERDAARAAGKLPVLVGDLAKARATAEVIEAKLANDHGILLDGESEVTMTWERPSSRGRPVHCRARLDHVWQKDGRILDLKFYASAKPDDVIRKVLDHGLDIQHAAYTDGFIRHHNELAGRTSFVLVFIEPSAPHAITVGELDGEWQDLGERRWQAAVDLWDECVTKNEWPGYGHRRLWAPSWALTRVEEQLA